MPGASGSVYWEPGTELWALSPGLPESQAVYVVAAQAFSWSDSHFNLSSGTPQLRQPKGTQLLLQHSLF